MTLVVSVQTRGSIWLLADRRLSTEGGPPKDTAVKMAALEATDGVALIGYAGLGATALGNEPSKWVVSTLIGYRVTIEESIEILAQATQREFLAHVRMFDHIPSRGHNFVIAALVGGEHRLYSIDLDGRANEPRFRHTRHVVGGKHLRRQMPPAIGIAGSGRSVLERNTIWTKKLLRVVKAYNGHKVSAAQVCDHLAGLCTYAHQHTPGGTVGSSCIVAWRNSKMSGLKGAAVINATRMASGYVTLRFRKYA